MRNKLLQNLIREATIIAYELFMSRQACNTREEEFLYPDGENKEKGKKTLDEIAKLDPYGLRGEPELDEREKGDN